MLRAYLRKRLSKLLIKHERELTSSREEKELDGLLGLADLAEDDPPPGTNSRL